jgi:site-specific DNA-methyltransferase (adenine-specific)
MFDNNERVWLMQGDCLERMKEIPSGSVDMVLTDPPYGTTACKWDSIIPMEPMWTELKRVIKPNGAIVMTASQPFTTTLIASNMKMFKYCWVWDKRRPSNPMLAKKQCLKVHEDIVVFYSKFGTYNPQGIFLTDGKPRGGTAPSKTELGFGKSIKEPYRQRVSGYPKSILTFGTDNSKNVHPTQKPVDLMEYLIKTYTNEDEVVLDFAAGSFSTGVACVNLNRRFVGIELDKDYFNIGINRIAERIRCLDLKIEPIIGMEG